MQKEQARGGKEYVEVTEPHTPLVLYPQMMNEQQTRQEPKKEFENPLRDFKHEQKGNDRWTINLAGSPTAPRLLHEKDLVFQRATTSVNLNQEEENQLVYTSQR